MYIHSQTNLILKLSKFYFYISFCSELTENKHTLTRLSDHKRFTSEQLSLVQIKVWAFDFMSHITGCIYNHLSYCTKLNGF